MISPITVIHCTFTILVEVSVVRTIQSPIKVFQYPITKVQYSITIFYCPLKIIHHLITMFYYPIKIVHSPLTMVCCSITMMYCIITIYYPIMKAHSTITMSPLCYYNNLIFYHSSPLFQHSDGVTSHNSSSLYNTGLLANYNDHISHQNDLLSNSITVKVHPVSRIHYFIRMICMPSQQFTLSSQCSIVS